MADTMQAVVAESLSGVSDLRIGKQPVPEPKPGQVLVRVKAAGINYADVMQARGLYAGGPKPPYIAGVEAAGEVVETTEGSSLKVGDQVMGYGVSAFAEYIAWPAGNLLPLPDGWTMEQGAAFPVQWLTAYGCLKTVGRLQEGDSVLIHAAAGGVGLAATKLAKHLGAKVFATASSQEKLELAKAHGADELINYSTQDFVAEVKARTEGQGVDLVLEMVGGETFERNFRAVKPYGRIVVFGSATAKQAVIDNTTLIFKPVEVIGYHLAVMAQKRPDLMMPCLGEVMQLVRKGIINPEPPTTFPLADAVRALSDLEARKTTGKLVLIP